MSVELQLELDYVVNKKCGTDLKRSKQEYF